MRVHIVQKGDTLWKIAKQYAIGFEELKRLNAHLANPDYIVPGMEIYLPDSAQKKETKHVVKEQPKPVKEQPIQGPAPMPAPAPVPAPVPMPQPQKPIWQGDIYFQQPQQPMPMQQPMYMDHNMPMPIQSNLQEESSLKASHCPDKDQLVCQYYEEIDHMMRQQYPCCPPQMMPYPANMMPQMQPMPYSPKSCH